MTFTIIDASVAVKWFLQKEPDRDVALSVLDKVKHNPSGYAVPDLFYCEMLHVFCRVFSKAGVVSESLRLLQDLGMSSLPTGRETLSLAAHISKEKGISGYDAIYASNAKLTGSVWLTADRKAHRKIAMLKISKYLGEK